MRNLIQSIFGTYTPVVDYDTDGVSHIVSGLAGVDWEYVAGVLLFAIVLISFFKILGALIKGR